MENKFLLEYQIKFSSEYERVANEFIKRVKIEANRYSYQNNLLVAFKRKNRVLPFEKNDDESLYKLVYKITEKEEVTENFGTEAGFFQNYGIKNTIILGPGNYARAHRSNEDITTKELKRYSDFLVKITREIDKCYNSNYGLDIYDNVRKNIISL